MTIRDVVSGVRSSRTVIALVALFAVLGGSAYAAKK